MATHKFSRPSGFAQPLFRRNKNAPKHIASAQAGFGEGKKTECPNCDKGLYYSIVRRNGILFTICKSCGHEWEDK